MLSTKGIQPGQCQIMVRAYANMLGLSRALARAGLVRHEARSISQFTSAFTRAQDLFDFVDAGEKKEGSDYKTRGKKNACPGNRARQFSVLLITDLEQRCFGCLQASTNAVTSTLLAATTPDISLC